MGVPVPIKMCVLATFHLGAFYTLWNLSSFDATLTRIQFCLLVFVGLSATAGGHRLFTHNAYEAVPVVHFVFMLGLIMGGTGSAIGWIATHRTHHQYTDTDLDPHDARNGLFYSHFGWIITPRSEGIIEACSKQDPTTLRFFSSHKFVDKYYSVMSMTLNAFLPWLLFRIMTGNSPALVSVLLTSCLRMVIGVNMAASVNSLAHIPAGIGTQPYMTTLPAYDNLLVALFTWGEGWHNYHHAYSKDYRASGHDNFLFFWNPAAALIRTLAALGLAYNCKVVADDKANVDVTIKNVGYQVLFKRNLKLA